MAAQAVVFVGVVGVVATCAYAVDVCNVMCGPGSSGPYSSLYSPSLVDGVHDVSAVADCEEARWQQFSTHNEKVLVVSLLTTLVFPTVTTT